MVFEISKYDMRDSFFIKLYKLLTKNNKYIILSNDYGAPQLDLIKRDFPKNIINMGITEQNMVSVASGLASRGFIPILYSISTFITRRSYEQLLLDVGIMNLPVLILGVGGGYAYSMDGPTHHAFDDLALIKSVPNSRIFSPSDNSFFEKLNDRFFDYKGLTYLRLDRGYKPLYINQIDNCVTRKDFHFIKNKSKNCILTYGGVSQILIKNEIYKKYNIIDLLKIHPLPNILNLLKTFKNSIIIEEHIFNGSVYSSLLNLINSKSHKGINLDGRYLNLSKVAGYGTRDFLHKKNKLFNKLGV